MIKCYEAALKDPRVIQKLRCESGDRTMEIRFPLVIAAYLKAYFPEEMQGNPNLHDVVIMLLDRLKKQTHDDLETDNNSFWVIMDSDGPWIADVEPEDHMEIIHGPCSLSEAEEALCDLSS